jgi:hypothetical protein
MPTKVEDLERSTINLGRKNKYNIATEHPRPGCTDENGV